MVNKLNPATPETSIDPATGKKIYHVGTLTYTRAALAILFCWLIWGDFCYTLMTQVTAPIMQFKFMDLKASNTEIGLILGTIPWAVYTILNPIISYKSDRFRSRWGRRIPFILFSLPFLMFSLVALAYGDQIAAWVFGHFGFLLRGLSANQVTILTLGALLVAFTFFSTFVNTTFWYLFNDVVPVHLLARFMSWFRTIGVLSSALYWWLIFPYSNTHSKEIFLGAATLYFVGFGLMCYNVKEGRYPPPTPYIGGQTGPIAAIKTYGKETHAFAHYWNLWICTSVGSIGGVAAIVTVGGSTTFGLFFLLAAGLDKDHIKIINMVLNITVGVSTLGAGWLADRFHPIRVVFAGNAINLFIATPATLFWLFCHPSPPVSFWVAMAIFVGVSTPAFALSGMWDPPLLMRLFPRSHYGQFGSINAVWRAGGTILGGGLAGAFLDFMTHSVGKERAYFYLPVWQFLFGLPSFYLFIKLYRSWKKHGGDEAYVAPLLLSGQNIIPSGVSPTAPAMESSKDIP